MSPNLALKGPVLPRNFTYIRLCHYSHKYVTNVNKDGPSVRSYSIETKGLAILFLVFDFYRNWFRLSGTAVQVVYEAGEVNLSPESSMKRRRVGRAP